MTYLLQVLSRILENNHANVSLFPNVSHLQICHEVVCSHHHVTAIRYGSCCDKSQCYVASISILRHFSRQPSLNYLTCRGIRVSIPDALGLGSVQSLTLKECSIAAPPFQNQAQACHLSLKNLRISTVYAFPFQVLQYCPDLQIIDSDNWTLKFASRASLLENTVDWDIVVVYSRLHTILFNNPYGISQLCNAAEAAGQLAFPAVEILEIIPVRNYRERDYDALYKIIRHSPNVKNILLSRTNGRSPA